MVSRPEAILYAVLERCSRSPEGYRFRATAAAVKGGLIEALIACGLLMVTRKDGRVMITDKGRKVLRVLAFKVEQNRKKPGLSPHRKVRLTLH